MIYPLSPAIGNGWIEDKSLCENNTGESFVQCMEEISYSTEDIININDANDVLNVKSVYTTNWDGIVQSVEIFKETAITYDFWLRKQPNKSKCPFVSQLVSASVSALVRQMQNKAK